jgi:hypothetical protein
MLVVHETVAVCIPDGGLITWKIKVRIEAVVPVSVPGISVAATPPRLAVMLVAVLEPIVTMIIAARFAPLPITKEGVVILVTPHWKPDLTELSYLIPTGATMMEAVAVCVRLPLTPVTVSVYVPTGTLASVVTESVDVPVAGFGAKLPAAPVGSPVTLSVTSPLKPPVGLIVTPYVVDPPTVIVRLAGDRLSV